MPSVHGQIDRILAEVRQFHLLNLQDEAGGHAAFARRKAYLCRRVQRRHDGLAIRIDKGNPEPLLAFFQPFKADLDRERAEGMRDRDAVRMQTIK